MNDYRTVSRIRRLTAFFLLLFATDAAADFILGGPETTAETPTVNLSAKASPERLPPGAAGAVRIRFGIPEGYKLYATEISISPEPAEGVLFGEPVQPPSVEAREPDGTPARFYKEPVEVELPVTVAESAAAGTRELGLSVRFRGCSETKCFLPETKRLAVPLAVEPKAPATSTPPAPAVSPTTETSAPVGLVERRASETDEPNRFRQTSERFGLIGVLVAAFLWGVFTSLTPCVYPMIPVTISVIGARGEGGVARGFWLSLVYVFGMSLTYALFGVIAAWSGGLFGAYSDHPAVRITVSTVFLLLALSMFDIFHIQMPSAVSSRLNRFSGRGFTGVFLTGAAAGMVVGPCVGPMLVGLLVYIATLGSKVQGFLIMWSFALGMGVLFMVIGAFSGAASALPRAGQWMATVKNAFGALMLGIALYYVRPLLPEPAFFLILGALLIGAGIFIGALDAMPETPSRTIRLRKTVGWICLALGIAYAARFALGDGLIARHNLTPGGPAIAWRTDLADSLATAAARETPVMVDFFAEWCTACDELDHKTFADPDVIRASEDFVAVRLDSTKPDAAHIRDILKRYRIVGLPTVLFLDETGGRLLQKPVTEYVPPSEMLHRMKSALAAHRNSHEP